MPSEPAASDIAALTDQVMALLAHHPVRLSRVRIRAGEHEVEIEWDARTEPDQSAESDRINGFHDIAHWRAGEPEHDDEPAGRHRRPADDIGI